MRLPTFGSLTKLQDLGLFVLRVGLGAMMMTHGVPKLTGGVERWEKLGGVMTHIGIDFAPVLWGFMAAFSEGVGGALVLLGLLTRPAAFLIVCTMAMAATMHWANGDGFGGMSHAIEMGIAFFGILIAGPGRYSLDQVLGKRDLPWLA